MSNSIIEYALKQTNEMIVNIDKLLTSAVPPLSEQEKILERALQDTLRKRRTHLENHLKF